MAGLVGKTAIVTGGGTGIGHGVAIALAREGLNIMLSGRRVAPLEETVTRIREQGGRARYFQGDVADENEVQKLVELTLSAYQSIDVLINNAGISGGSPIHEHSIEEWDNIMAVNLRGPFLMMRAVLPHMRRQRSGQIINISSESGLSYYSGDGAYGVGKHALNALAEYVQRENQEFNIRINTICPGMVVSEMTYELTGLDLAKCLMPDDIAELVIWLLSRRPNIKIGTPILIQTMENPWK